MRRVGFMAETQPWMGPNREHGRARVAQDRIKLALSGRNLEDAVGRREKIFEGTRVRSRGSQWPEERAHCARGHKLVRVGSESRDQAVAQTARLFRVASDEERRNGLAEEEKVERKGE
eukprot:gene1415-15832_t